MSIGFQCNSIDFLILYQFERIFWIDLKYINNILKKPFETKAKYIEYSFGSAVSRMEFFVTIANG